MNALQRDYGPRGVQLIVINSNDPHLYPDESYARMVERAAEDGYSFPYLVDDGQRVAKAYGATCTFHVFVLDGDRHLRYEGRFDDARIAARVTSHDLANALEDLLAGPRRPTSPTTRPSAAASTSSEVNLMPRSEHPAVGPARAPLLGPWTAGGPAVLVAIGGAWLTSCRPGDRNRRGPAPSRTDRGRRPLGVAIPVS